VPRTAFGTAEHASGRKRLEKLLRMSKYKDLFHSVTQTIFCPTVTQSQKLLLSRRVARLPMGRNVTKHARPTETRRFLTRYHVGRR